jgi:peptidoglycan/xylan/chitin deacetylase (PgdA/CDA1 family)
MKNIDKLIIRLILSTLSFSVFSQQNNKFHWPNHAKAAVSLAYDDALLSQLEHAIPALNARGLKASFYLTLASPIVGQKLSTWRAVAAQGHELANHSLFHACSSKKPNRQWVSVDNDLELKTVQQLVTEISLANDYLHAIDGETERTFTVPCADTDINGVNYVEKLDALFVGIKYQIGDIEQQRSALNPLRMSVWSPEKVTGKQLIDYVKQAAKYGTMANITFHGIGGDHLAVSIAAHNELLDYLAANKNVYWVDTYRNISRYLSQAKH